MRRKALLSCLLCLGLCTGYLALGWLLTSACCLLFPQADGSYGLAGAVELLLAGAFLAVLLAMKLGHRLRFRWGEFLRGFAAGGFLWALSALLLISGLAARLTGLTEGGIESPAAAVFFVITVGLAEELVFRGLIQNLLLDGFGRAEARTVWPALLVSGLVFGLAHLTNSFYGIAPLAALYQAVAATAVGLYFGAVYLRCGSLWAVALLHACNDLAALAAGSAAGTATFAGTVSAYGPERLVTAALYLALTAFLLRPKQMQRCLTPTA